jgi:hypothetical protein
MRRFVVALFLTASLTGCQQLDTNRTVEPYASFGAAIYREGCQRVAYTGQLAQQAAGQIATVDVAGTLGHNVCVSGMAPPANAPPKLTAIVGQKSELIATVDAMLPQPFLTTLETFLEQLLPLSDDGTMERAISSLGNLLGTLAQDPDFGPALSRLALRNGYRPTNTAAGLMHTIVNYPNIDPFIGKLLGLIAPGGTAENEWKTLLAAGSMELRASQPVANPGDPERTLALALDLMLAHHPDLADAKSLPLVQRDYRGLVKAPVVAGKVQPPFVDLNNDGLADVDAMGRFVDGSGNPLSLPSPFPELGVNDTAPRNMYGQALTAAGSNTTLYQYMDLDGSLFGGVTKETLPLMDPTKDTTLGLVWGMSSLLGPRASQTKLYMDSMGGMIGSLTYNGFDTTQSAVLDLMHAFIQVLGDPNADKTLQATSTLLNQYESPTARLVGAMLDASDRGKQHPEAMVPATSDIYDDLMPIVNRILLIKGLPEDLMNALEKAPVKDLAPIMAELMVASNQLDFDHANGPSYPLTSNLNQIQPVDRTKPDTDYNRSLMQRIAHLIHDSNGVQFCNKDGANPTVVGLPLLGGPYAKCKMFEIDDLALFYILNMQTKDNNGKPISANASAISGADFCGHITAGGLLATGCSALIQSMVGINGFTQYPQAPALNRSLFLRANEKSSFMQASTDDVLCRDGDKFIDVHDKSLFAWEAPFPNAPSGNTSANFYTAIAPVVDAFAAHDECIAYDSNNVCTKTQNAAKILVDLFAMLHEHWTSPNGSYFGHTYQSADATQPRFAYPDNVVSYEPLLSEVLGQGDLMPSLIALAPTLNTMTLDGTANTPAARPYLIATAKYLFTPGAAPGVAYRNGATSTVMSDGTTPVKVATPYYLIADAYAHKRAALAAGGAMQSAAWKASTSTLVDQFLTIQKNASTWQFQDRKFRAISLLVINFLRSRIAAHTQAGDVDTWVHQTLTQNLTDTLGGPVFSALADFVNKVENDPDARTQLYQLLQYLVDEVHNDPGFQTALTTLADQAQMFLDDPDLVPVARALGSALDPQKGAVDAQLTLMKRAHDLDTNKALLTILQNLYKQDATGIYPASNLADVLSELNRQNPGQGGDLSGDDYKAILREVQGFLTDDQRGFTRFLAIVQNRGPH